MRNLACLPSGGAGHVNKVNASGGMKRRLMDLGLTRGTRVQALFASPGGSMRAYRIRGTVIALRKKDAESVELGEGAHE